MMAATLLPPLPADLSAWLADRGWIMLLVAARVAGLCWTAPALSAPGMGMRSRLAAALALAAVVAPAVDAPGREPETIATAWRFGSAFVAEGLIGAVLGWMAALILAGARQAGEVVGAQAGLAPAALFDPESGDEMTALGHLYGLVALGIFLALDGPLGLVKAAVESYRVLPAGAAVATDSAVSFAFGRVGDALALAVRAAAPAAVALVLAGLALGLLGRTAPSMQRAALALPLRTLLGLALVALTLGALAATLAASWDQFFRIEGF